MSNITIPDSAIQYLKQYKDFKNIEEELKDFLHVSSTEETVNHMAVRLATQDELFRKKELVAKAIVETILFHHWEDI